jgi:phosphoribosyl 1,2-cyclic phosphodiesterase
MIITLYGTRGSIAVANKETKKYGGNTTCLYVESTNGDVIVVDAGTGIRELGTYLVEKKTKKIYLLFTHYHWDHIQGFPFFGPVFDKNVEIEIYASKDGVTAKEALTYQMTKPYFPAALNDLPARITFKELKEHNKIGSLEVFTITNNHPDPTRGLKFSDGKNSFGFLTDNELHAQNNKTPYNSFVEFLKGVKFFIHDAQYTEQIYKNRNGWGHSTFDQVMKLAQDADVKTVLFTHHDHGSTDGFIDGVLKEYRKKYRDINVMAAADGKTILLK